MEEYGKLLAEKQAEYERFKDYRQKMIEYQTAKQNVDRILGIQQEEQAQRGYQEQQREQERMQKLNQNPEH